MSINFNSRDFENPSLQKFYSGLQALALNEDEPEPVKDLLEPDYENRKIFKPIVDKFKNAFFGGEEEDESCGNTGAAKGRGRAAANPRKVPAKVIKNVVNIESDEEVKQPAKKRAKANNGNS